MNKTPQLNLPRFEMRLQTSDDIVKVWDSLRKKYVVLTPEEFVRQHFINWLVSYLDYPAAMVANEISIEFNSMRRRCDTVVFSKSGEPVMIVEYKAPTVQITQDVFDQIYRYNSVLKVKYLVVSNGIRHFCCVMDYANDTYHFIPKIPAYTAL